MTKIAESSNNHTKIKIKMEKAETESHQNGNQTTISSSRWK